MKNTLAILGSILAFVLVIVTVYALRYGGQEARAFFEPRDRAIDRQVFEQTPSFVHGKTQHISRLRREYERATTETQRASLREMILAEASVVDNTLLPLPLQTFLGSL